MTSNARARSRLRQLLQDGYRPSRVNASERTATLFHQETKDRVHLTGLSNTEISLLQRSQSPATSRKTPVRSEGSRRAASVNKQTQPRAASTARRARQPRPERPAGAANADVPASFVEAVSGWQERLLQLDRKNHLLYFKPGRSAVLVARHTGESEWTAHSADTITALLSTTRSLSFDYVDPRTRLRRTAFDAAEAERQEEEFEPRVIRGDLLSDCPTSELQRRLSILRRRTAEWEQEQGAECVTCPPD